MAYKVLSADMPQLKTVIPVLEQVHDSGIFSNYGPIEQLYREQIGDRIGIEPQHIVTCANATLGIQGICSILNFEVWEVQNWTFPATGLAVQNSRRTISFYDVSLRDWTVDPQTMHLHRGGLISTVPFGAKLSNNYSIQNGFHIIDAAASLGNLDKLSNLKRNTAVVFSLHATKILGCGEGGMVVFGDPELAKEFKSWTNFGFSGDRNSRRFGATNGKLSEIGCAYALASLQEFPEKLFRYGEMRKRVNSISLELGILPEVMNDDRISPYWIVQFDSIEKRNLVEKQLNSSNIETRRWWPKPLSQMPAFRNQRVEVLDDSNASYLAGTTLGLPFHLKLSDKDIDKIGSKLAEASC